MNDTVIKIPWAKSVDEKLIHIHDAVKGQNIIVRVAMSN